MAGSCRFKIAILALMLACFAPANGLARVAPQDPEIDSILAGAEQQFRKGEACFAAGEMDCARRAFDRAIDFFLESEIDVRSDERLYKVWRSMIEKINRYQVDAVNGERASGWKMQEFEGRYEEIAETDEFEAEDAEAGPLTSKEFQSRFARLQNLFLQKYGREFVVTGSDHSEHRRLYGAGSAVDVRVRDLSSDQISYIIKTGTRLGLRVRDFSTWDKVSAHNDLTYRLGRPLDTLATGPHLHIDRMVTSGRSRADTKLVTKKKEGKVENPHKNR